MCHCNRKKTSQILVTLTLKQAPVEKEIAPEKSRINKKVIKVKQGYVLL